MKCGKCKNEITNEMEFCPECGTQIITFNKLLGKSNNPKKLNEKPTISAWTILLVLILTCFFVIPGLIVGLLVWYNHKKKVEEWQRDQLLEKMDSLEQRA